MSCGCQVDGSCLLATNPRAYSRDGMLVNNTECNLGTGGQGNRYCFVHHATGITCGHIIVRKICLKLYLQTTSNNIIRHSIKLP